MRFRSKLRKFSAGRYALGTSLVLVFGIPSLAVAFGEGQPLTGGERNPTPNSARAYDTETEIIAENTTYGTRQSNTQNGDGGGAIYGCRSRPGNEPCLRANNLNNGRAFEFETDGREGGRIEVGNPDGPPLTTNAHGVATNFNADQVDGREARDFASAADLKWAAVGDGGELGPNRGAASARIADATNNVYAVRFDRAVSECSFTANPTSTTRAYSLGVRAGNQPDEVLVHANGATGFHLQVIC